MNSTIDFDVIAAHANLPSIMARSGVEVRNGKAFCPFHENKNTPAMTVFQVGGRWRFDCKGCGIKGDAITWISEMDKIGPREAARKLAGIESPTSSRDGPGISVARRSSMAQIDSMSLGYRRVSEPFTRFPEKPPPWSSDDWQDAADEMIRRAENRLWSVEGAGPLDWLRQRGLLDFTIKRFRLGFNSEWERSRDIESLRENGGRAEGIKAPRGITIPWCHPEAWYHSNESPPGPRWVGCNVRRLASPDVFAPLPPGLEKCSAFRGSRRGYPYPHADLVPGLPVLMVEGEWDALIAWQELGWLVNIVSVGSAEQDPKPEALETLLDCPSWLIALHNDPAGNEGSKKWDKRSRGKAIRLMLKPDVDLNEMHQSGEDLREWLKTEYEDLGWKWTPGRG